MFIVNQANKASYDPSVFDPETEKNSLVYISAIFLFSDRRTTCLYRNECINVLHKVFTNLWYKLYQTFFLSSFDRRIIKI